MDISETNIAERAIKRGGASIADGCHVTLEMPQDRTPRGAISCRHKILELLNFKPGKIGIQMRLDEQESKCSARHSSSTACVQAKNSCVQILGRAIPISANLDDARPLHALQSTGSVRPSPALQMPPWQWDHPALSSSCRDFHEVQLADQVLANDEVDILDRAPGPHARWPAVVAIFSSSLTIPELPGSSIALRNSPGSFSRSNSSLRSQLR